MPFNLKEAQIYKGGSWVGFVIGFSGLVTGAQIVAGAGFALTFISVTLYMVRVSRP